MSCTTHKPLFRDPCESWTCMCTLSHPVHFTGCATREPLFHDLYGLWNNGLSRTVCEVYIIRGAWGVYAGPRLVWVVEQWFASGTVCELHIIGGTFGSDALRMKNIRQNCLSSVCIYLCSSPIVRLVNHCLTTCMGRTSHVKPFTVVSFRQYWTRME